jgi:hypothetical protein
MNTRLISIGCAALIGACFPYNVSYAAATNTQTAGQIRELEASLAPALKLFASHAPADTPLRYSAAFAHLNDTQNLYAIVYVEGGFWCGSGGCPLVIFVRDGESWKEISETSITRPPICVLSQKSHGWDSIGVWVEGGGIIPGYMAGLPFDGEKYPSNPSMPPAFHVKSGSACEIVIPTAKRMN